MASKSTKSIPFLVIAIIILGLGVEVVTEKDVDLETLVPILSILAGSGAALSAVKSAKSIRQQIPQDIIDTIKAKLKT